eukprot:TRINITY_DN90233_c0_g1_i1.p1 TRINITY_DN90233_c0_g1~~TRINITY_DN90233_c0_g1_i1.p1  ORF type:complete len:511 (-),score=84.73 TRINITY_DN90233_c0_g1_i1:58-1590(-)
MQRRSQGRAQRQGTEHLQTDDEDDFLVNGGSAPPRRPDAPVFFAPLGSWSLADLKALPRFPERDSFAMAKELIRAFLRDAVGYLDLRIALFWLGFGLLGMPTISEPALHLVPLCKDLATYADTAEELGYDPSASVHGSPVPLLSSPCSTGSGVLGVLGQGLAASASPLMQGRGQSASSSAGSSGRGSSNRALLPAHTVAAGYPAMPGSSGGSSSSSAATSFCSGAYGRGVTLAAASGQQGAGLLRQREGRRKKAAYAEQMAILASMQSSSSSRLAAAGRPQSSSAQLVGSAADAIAASSEGILAAVTTGDDAHSDSGLDKSCPSDRLDSDSSECGEFTRGASSTQLGEHAGGRNHEAWRNDNTLAMSLQFEEDEAAAASTQVYPWKVKLLHAGGWSSGSSSESDGRRTPPAQPGASSSTGGGAGSAESQGGLDASHVEQFTVTFISDLQMHEDLQEVSCLCTFCLDEMKLGDELCRLPCMHTFHRQCVHSWLARDRRCMLCRLDVTRPRG